MHENKLIIAAAGSGKTTFLINEALKITSEKVLITTFTNANEEEIKSKFIQKNKCIPENVVIKTWFSLLLQHGVKPYLGYCYAHDIKGMQLVSGQSTKGIPEKQFEIYYLNSSKEIYSDKISKLLVECNKKSGGKVIARLSRIYPHIFIDEIQDMAGYDLSFIELLLKSNISILLVGDPRQGTFSTNDPQKNKKFSKSAIVDYFKNLSKFIEIDECFLTTNYRSVPEICTFSDRLYPEYQYTKPGSIDTSSHKGIFLVREKDIDKYLDLYNPMQLRYDKRKEIRSQFQCMNFGASKGLTFDRVLIYSTTPIIKWMQDNRNELTPSSRSKLYVAITRAKYSVAFVYDFKDTENIDGISKFTPGDDPVNGVI